MVTCCYLNLVIDGLVFRIMTGSLTLDMRRVF